MHKFLYPHIECLSLCLEDIVSDYTKKSQIIYVPSAWTTLLIVFRIGILNQSLKQIEKRLCQGFILNSP